jgi:hypothetical protein
MATLVAGELYYEIDGQMAEIKRQLRQRDGYPFNPALLKIALQDAVEGKFGGAQGRSLFTETITVSLGEDAVSMLTFSRSWTFAGAAAALLGLSTSTETEFLGRILSSAGYPMTREQAMKSAEKMGVSRRSELGVFFFKSRGELQNHVSVSYFHPSGLHPDGYERGLDFGGSWMAGGRLLIRNFIP